VGLAFRGTSGVGEGNRADAAVGETAPGGGEGSTVDLGGASGVGVAVGKASSGGRESSAGGVAVAVARIGGRLTGSPVIRLPTSFPQPITRTATVAAIVTTRKLLRITISLL